MHGRRSLESLMSRCLVRECQPVSDRCRAVGSLTRNTDADRTELWLAVARRRVSRLERALDLPGSRHQTVCVRFRTESAVGKTGGHPWEKRGSSAGAQLPCGLATFWNYPMCSFSALGNDSQS